MCGCGQQSAALGYLLIISRKLRNLRRAGRPTNRSGSAIWLLELQGVVPFVLLNFCGRLTAQRRSHEHARMLRHCCSVLSTSSAFLRFDASIRRP